MNAASETDRFEFLEEVAQVAVRRELEDDSVVFRLEDDAHQRDHVRMTQVDVHRHFALQLVRRPAHPPQCNFRY